LAHSDSRATSGWSAPTTAFPRFLPTRFVKALRACDRFDDVENHAGRFATSPDGSGVAFEQILRDLRASTEAGFLIEQGAFLKQARERASERGAGDLPVTTLGVVTCARLSRSSESSGATASMRRAARSLSSSMTRATRPRERRLGK